MKTPNAIDRSITVAIIAGRSRRSRERERRGGPAHRENHHQITRTITAKMEGPNSSTRRRVRDGSSGGEITGDSDGSSRLSAGADSWYGRHGGGGGRSSAMVHSPLAGSILDYLDAVIRVLELGFHPRACPRIKMSPIAEDRARDRRDGRAQGGEQVRRVAPGCATTARCARRSWSTIAC